MSVIVLDRDGVINYDSADYIKSADEWHPLPGSMEAIAMLCAKGYKVYIATNQAGLARGLFTSADLEAMHQKLQSLVQDEGGEVSGIFFCPHHPDEHCLCRKPQPGLLDQIQTHSGISMRGMPFVGDSLKDLQAALAINARPILVRTGNGRKTEARLGELTSPVEVFDDLLQFANQQEAIPGSSA